MDLINENAIAAAMQPVLQAVTTTAIDRVSEHLIPELRSALDNLGPQIQKGLTDALDGLTITVTFARKEKT